MEEHLNKIRTWIRRGNLKQFSTQIAARLAAQNYTVELAGDTVTFYRQSTKRGGVMGMGKKQVREPVLVITQKGSAIDIPEETADPQFLEFLAGQLKEH